MKYTESQVNEIMAIVQEQLRDTIEMGSATKGAIRSRLLSLEQPEESSILHQLRQRIEKRKDELNTIQYNNTSYDDRIKARFDELMWILEFIGDVKPEESELMPFTPDYDREKYEVATGTGRIIPEKLAEVFRFGINISSFTATWEDDCTERVQVCDLRLRRKEKKALIWRDSTGKICFTDDIVRVDWGYIRENYTAHQQITITI